jgi:tetratricopeptide (TPR) repeat protein
MTMTAEHHAPDYLPREVLARDDFKQACERRELGVMLQLASKWGGEGFSVSHVARRCQMSIGQVQAYIKQGRQPQDKILERVADGLHIPGGMLGMKRRPWEDGLAGPVHIFIPEQASDSEPGEDFDVLMMVQEADRTDIGLGTIDSLYAIFDKLCRDYPSVAAPELRQKLKRLYTRIMELRHGRITLAQHRELIAVSAWVTALLACVDWDMNEREAAETARNATLRFAKEIGHSELTAWSYEMEAWFALTEGRHGDVTKIAKSGQEIGGENSAMVQLIMQEARGWSRLGQKRMAESAMHRGYDMLQRLPKVDYPRHFVYDSTKFPFYAASCYQWLGDDAKAEEYAQQVLRECDDNGTTERSPMRMAETYITLGLVQTHHGNVEAAVHSGSQALTYDRRTQPHLLIRMAELHQAVMEKFPDASEARGFDERFRALRDRAGSPAKD